MEQNRFGRLAVAADRRTDGRTADTLGRNYGGGVVAEVTKETASPANGGDRELADLPPIIVLF